MDGRTFLDIARELLAGTTEAHWRSASGRSYYAVLLEAKAALDRWGIVLPRRDPLHAAIRLRFAYATDADLRLVGKALDDLVRLRNKADYDLASPGPFVNSSTTATAITQAEEAIQKLDEVGADSTRLAAAVADIRTRFP
jgi:hypothetical protein